MTCPQCGNTLTSGATFCGDCGAPINKAESSPSAVAASPGAAKLRALSDCMENCEGSRTQPG